MSLTDHIHSFIRATDTPPVAPVISTLSPGCRFAWKRSPRRATAAVHIRKQPSVPSPTSGISTEGRACIAHESIVLVITDE